MSELDQTRPSAESLEQALCSGLARGDVVIATMRPILRHLLANGDQSLFNDEVIAKVRGMLSHLARQLLVAVARAGEMEDIDAFVEERQPALAQLFLEDTAFLSHVHALTIEAQIAEQLQRRSGIDCVLTPLLQELAAGKDEGQAAMAMRVLAAQARFLQQIRRMNLPLVELPGDLFEEALQVLRTQIGDELVSEGVEAGLRQTFDEADSRLGLISRLVMLMGRGAHRALAIDHAGVAIFGTALAMASEQDRGLALLSFAENQIARLALSLRAAGLKQRAVEEQFMYLHPDVALPEGFERMSVERAAQLLAAARLDIAA